ncbi:MAG: hypothetical protein ACK4GK_06700 [Ferrovibrio sp.]|jgi:hypothetical protein
MPSTQQQRVKEIEKTYLDVMRNYRKDMADTRSEDEAKFVEENWNKAESVYLDAINEELSKTANAAESAYEALRTANNVVKQARKNSQTLAERADALAEATQKAATLLQKAKA